MAIGIDRNTPVPQRRHCKYPWPDMRPDADSFVVGEDDYRSARQSGYMWCRRNAKDLTVTGFRQDDGTYRIGLVTKREAS